MDGVKQQDSTPQNDLTLGFKWVFVFVALKSIMHSLGEI
jgi:hypothetical protein